MKNKEYEIHVNILNEKPPKQIQDDFNYTIDEIINRILKEEENSNGTQSR